MVTYEGMETSAMEDNTYNYENIIQFRLTLGGINKHLS
jgi:hypothetical protein